jgi:uncharacterized membrane protein|tara:strand:- start:320 stop:523 length:204 start_codon:yes stop_codon:yes gene_type:complete
MKSQAKRSIAKAITWRITASLDTFVIAWIITGSIELGGFIAGVEAVTKIFIYYVHERIWNRIKWGRK